MKNLVFVLMLFIFGACSKDDDNSSGIITRATVKDARFIYENSVTTRASTRATTEEVQRFMTINSAGEVKPIRFVTGSGDTLDMEIRQVRRLNKDYLFMRGLFMFNGVSIFNLVVNKNTEIIYAVPDKIQFNLNADIFSDQYNNSYLSNYECIMKMNLSDPENITLENYTPKVEFRTDEYYVNKNGVCFYDLEFFKCPGGRVYSIKELISEPLDADEKDQNTPDFQPSMDGMFIGEDGNYYIHYSHRYSRHDEYGNYLVYKIYRIDEIGNNELKATKVVGINKLIDYNNGNDYINRHIYLYSPESKTFIASDGNHTFEYNEQTKEFRQLNIKLPSFDGYPYKPYNAYSTSEAIYVLDEDNKKLCKLNGSDYSVTEISLIEKGFEIKAENFVSSIDSPELSFSGFRYSDGKNVVGVIKASGEFVVNENTKSANEIVTLLRLN